MPTNDSAANVKKETALLQEGEMRQYALPRHPFATSHHSFLRYEQDGFMVVEYLPPRGEQKAKDVARHAAKMRAHMAAPAN